ncbi:MAG: hypothetical protein Tsb0034_12280 [Ekhidna sp.]
MTNSTKPPVWFWVVAVLALIWNLMGVGAYLQQAYASDDLLSQMEKAVADLIAQRPAWATAAFATAVWGGALGSLLLLLRKKLAHIVLVVSLVGIVIQMYYNYFMARSLADYGPGDHVMSVMILGFGIYLIFFAKKGIAADWLR